ncbi:hypothetical protein N2152v2_010417 [Parachlorella kessleri]
MSPATPLAVSLPPPANQTSPGVGGAVSPPLAANATAPGVSPPASALPPTSNQTAPGASPAVGVPPAANETAPGVSPAVSSPPNGSQSAPTVSQVVGVTPATNETATGNDTSLAEVPVRKQTVNSEIQAALASPLQFSNLFSNWTSTYGKAYANDTEQAARQEVFRQNLQRMVQINSQPNAAFWLQPGPFSDQTDEEFVAGKMGAGYFSGQRPSLSAAGRRLQDVQLLLPGPLDPGPMQANPTSSPASTASLPGGIPDYKDWVVEGKVTPVKDQQNCGSCWAFSAAAAFESKLAIEQGIPWDQSVQQLVDCVGALSGYTPRTGCGPGFSTEALGYLQATGGDSTAAYGSYQAQKGSCTAPGYSPGMHYITSSPGYRGIPASSATELMKAGVAAIL